MQTNNLQELRSLRIQEKAIKARIETIMPAAQEEAVALQPDGGKFSVENVGDFILDKEGVIDMVGNPKRYTMPEAVEYRQKDAEQKVLKAQSSAITKLLKTIKDIFLKTHPGWVPDRYVYTLKVLI